MAIPVPTPAGDKPRVRNIDFKALVVKHVNLNAPELRYHFSNGRKFFENPNSKTGPYE